MHDPHQLPLRMLDLIVHPAQNPLVRSAVIVLDEVSREARGLFEIARIEAFEEKAAKITENLWLQQQHLGQRGPHDVVSHGNIVLSNELKEVLAVTALAEGAGQLLNLP